MARKYETYIKKEFKDMKDEELQSFIRDLRKSRSVMKATSPGGKRKIKKAKTTSNKLDKITAALSSEEKAALIKELESV